MDAYRVSKVVGSNPRFTSPFNEPCSYYIVGHGEDISEKAIELYWKRLEYAERNADLLIRQGFNPSFYEFYGVNKGVVKSAADMCQRLIVDSFVLHLQDNATTVGCCLSNPEFMFGHFIEYEWDCDWNLIYSCIC